MRFRLCTPSIVRLLVGIAVSIQFSRNPNRFLPFTHSRASRYHNKVTSLRVASQSN